MNKNRLPREQELSLLGKLSSDDAFRTRYETDPRAALKEMGVTDSTLASLDPAGLAPASWPTRPSSHRRSSN
jgi:putative modified peptide